MTIPAKSTKQFFGVILPAPLAQDLRQTAQAKGVTASDVTRQALTWYLSAMKSNPQTSDKVTT